MNSPKVRVIYDPILRQPVKPVTVFDSELKKLAEEMLAVMHQNSGMGLATNQLGVDKDLFVLEYRPPKNDDKLSTQPGGGGSKSIAPLALCNAKVIKVSQEISTLNEGCLSLPGLEMPVSRPSGVTVEAQNLIGQSVTVKAKGLLARILQHEIDHLDGIIFTDRATDVKNIKHYRWAKIVFFGSDQFSAPILEGLIKAGLNVTAVVTETDKPAGRGNQLVEPAVKKLATACQVAVAQPETKDEISALLTQLQPDLVVLASYGKILPAEALATPIYGALNVHPSLLPKYRGATPLQTAILTGDQQSGVTIMKMNAGIDTGEIVSQTAAPIAPDETFLSLRARLSTLGSQLLLKTLPLYLSGQAKIRIQTGVTTQTTKLTKEMGEINWTKTAAVIDRQIRALNPWPGTFTFIGAKRLKILDAKIEGKKIIIKTVQLEGKNPTSWAEFVRGHQDGLKKCSWYDRISSC